MKTSNLRLSLAITLMVLGQVAHADLIDKRSKVPETNPVIVPGTAKVVPVVAGKSVELDTKNVPVYFKEESPALGMPASGFGTDISLTLALKQLLPEYTVQDDFGKDVKVNWKASGSIKETLQSMTSTEKDVSVVLMPIEKKAVIADKTYAPKLVERPLVQEWDVRSNDVRLDRTLARWAKRAGMNFKWDAEKFYSVSVPSTFYGTFQQAVIQALSTPGIAKSDYPLEACIWGNNPPLLRITRMGEQSDVCR